MLIKLDSSIINKDEPWSDELLSSLENLAIAMREKKHLIAINPKTKRAIKKHPSFNELGIRSQQVYLEIYDSGLQAYFDMVSQYIEVTQDCISPTKIERGDKIIIQVPVSFFEDSEIIQKTVLLCENQEDTKFYEMIARVYLKSKRLNNKINFAFTSQGGGGSTIASEYENIQLSKSRFCLCIVDSDKLSPNSSNGKTAKRLLDQYDANLVKTELYILQVREIENLIPSSILLELFDNDRNREKAYQLLDAIEKSSVSEIRKYLDIKKGTYLKPILVKEETVKEFWEAKISLVDDINQQFKSNCQINSECLDSWKCINKKDCQCFITLSFGDNTLLNMMQWYQEKANPSKVLEKVKNDQLFSEWEIIGQKLINWCIIGSRVGA